MHGRWSFPAGGCRRLGVDRKTVKRALSRETAPAGRQSPPRGLRLDAYRAEVEAWLREEPRLTAKRLGALLREKNPAIHVRERTDRRFVARIRGTAFPKEAFIHRTRVDSSLTLPTHGRCLTRSATRADPKRRQHGRQPDSTS